jgi:outer membrane protein assembly factor BamA
VRKILDRTLILVGFCGLWSTAHAQSPQPKAAVGWEFVGIPALNFSTDEGLGYGALAEIYNYGNGLKPYKYTIQPIIFLTTKGRRDLVVFFDAPHVLPNRWRFDVTLAREQHRATPYYGIGNATVYDSTLELAPDDYYYRYEKVQLRVFANVQRPLGSAPARVLVGFGYTDVTTDATPFDSGTTLLTAHLGGSPAPVGNVGFVRAGVIWDTRDRESGPTRGTWAELLAQRVDDALGATNEFTRVTATVRHYIPLRDNLVAAFRVMAQQSSGDVPLFELNTLQSSYKNQEGLGGNNSVRGVAKNRFAGNGVMLANTELRWRFKEFSLRGKPAFLMASGFLDAGRVWTNSIQVGEIVKDLHAGYGGGLRVGLGPSFVVAFDYGRSSESSQLYIGLGYLF